MRTVPVVYKGCNSYTIVDDEDYQRVLDCGPWYLHIKGYAINKHGVLMHSTIIGDRSGFVHHHKDEDKLNNQKFNLEFITNTENITQCKGWSSSGFKGVSFHQKNSKFVAGIRVNGKQKYLGSFKSAEDAARAYDKAAIESFGSKTFVNFQ